MTTAPSVILIGNFDGLHLGHRALFRMARRIADQRGARVVAVTFTRHPSTALRPEQAPPNVHHREQRARLITEAGADAIDWLEPAPDLLSVTPERFIETMVERHQPLAVVEGPDFRFGHRRAGDVELLEKLGSEMGFEVHVAPWVTVALRDKLQARVSSTLVRWLIGHGRVADARLCLDRPWRLRGEVVEGEKRGRTIGVPTANLDTGLQMLPADGVYAGAVQLDGRDHAAAISVGVKPTFEGRQRVCEAHVLDLDADLYGRTLEIDMLRWVRDQWRFASVEALVARLRSDLRTIRHLHATGLLDAADLVHAVGR